MRARPLSLALVAFATAGLTALASSPVTAATTTATGTSTSVSPYVLPVADGVGITSLFTVGDDKAAGNGYEMVGIPDGLGAFAPKDGTTTVLMNHELRPNAGITRRHGEKGAFVSKLTIDDATGTVLAGEDFIKPGVQYWDYASDRFAAAPVAPEDYVTSGPSDLNHKAAFARFCSGYLSAPGELQVGKGGPGYDGQIYFANEETGDEGRVFGVTEDGQAYQLPRLGLFSWENTIVAPAKSRTTVVMGNEDTGEGELWVYVGRKEHKGSPVDQAGLTNGDNHVIKIDGVTTDAGFRSTFGKGVSAPFSLQDIEWDQSGKAQNDETIAEGGLVLNRIEDGAFNPANPREYYFLTTEGGDRTPFNGVSRDGGGLWKLTFANVERPDLGGTLELVLDGTETFAVGESGLSKPDNMMIDAAGNLLIQEDPGGNDHLARILSYRLTDGARGVVARFDSALFGPTIPTGTTPATRAVLTTDEESSGIIQLTDGSYLFDAQVHTAKGLATTGGKGSAEEYVERGQLLRMTVPSFSTVYTVLP